jgi:phosphatidate cytidylyltransferase
MMSPADTKEGAPGVGPLAGDLAVRITSAVVLAGIATGATWAGLLPFTGLVAAIALVMAWEWGRLVRERGIDAALVLHVVVMLLACGLAAVDHAALATVAVIGGAIAMLAVAFDRQPQLSALGVLVIGLAVIALVWIRRDETYGFEAVLFVFLVVWATDTSAMIAGRSIGGPKLWPSLSPNKTWAGFFGGIVGALLIAGLFALLVPKVPLGPLLLKAALLALACHAGDLSESALKRAFGIKDASNLIPGHGGFMDRLDGFVVAAVVAGIMAAAGHPSHPARALMFGQ